MWNCNKCYIECRLGFTIVPTEILSLLYANTNNNATPIYSFPDYTHSFLCGHVTLGNALTIQHMQAFRLIRLKMTVVYQTISSITQMRMTCYARKLNIFGWGFKHKPQPKIQAISFTTNDTLSTCCSLTLLSPYLLWLFVSIAMYRDRAS